jgi:hypothetical protein
VTDNLLRPALLIALCPALTVLVFFLICRTRQTSQALNQPLFKQMRRRAAGESFRARLEDRDHQIHSWLIYLAVCPAIVGLAAGLIKVPGPVLPATLLCVSFAWSAVCAWKLLQLTRGRTDLTLEFDARRLVGEELNRLTAEGFEVYHDQSFAGANVDHVLIGPPGIFAIETKVQRKAGDSSSSEPDRLEFDGFRVRWGKGAESYGLERAVANAQAVEQWLKSAVGEAVATIPILTLPGWTIDPSAANQNVLVLNPKDIVRLCYSKTVILPEDLIRRICRQMDLKSSGQQP